MKRILRLTATPHAIAAGVAAGAFTSFTPFMGFHFILAFVLAWLVRGNLLASALGTFVGNPLTFPLIWAAAYSTGHFILQTGTSAAGGASEIGAAMSAVGSAIWAWDWTEALSELARIWDPLVLPMLVGGCLVGTIFAIPCYLLVRRAAILFRESRRNQLLKIAEQIRERAQVNQMAKSLAKSEKEAIHS